MFILQVTSCLRRSICSYAISYQRNQLCKTCFKEIYIHPATFRFYTRKSESHRNFSKPLKYIYESKHAKVGNLEPWKGHKHNKVIDTEKLFQNPVGYLISIYSIVKRELEKECIGFKTELIQNQYKCTIDISWPEKLSFVDVGPNKKAAEKHAAVRCLNWLCVHNKIKNLKPVLYSNHEIEVLMNTPIRINLDSNFKSEIRTLIDTFNNVVKFSIDNPPTIDDKEGMLNTRGTDFSSFKMKAEDCRQRNAKLMNSWKTRTPKNNDLPIFNCKKKILDSLEKNRILLIKGETSCGKSTQVPQFIIDAFAEKNKAVDCNILVSEPRKISAISLAQRIANERNESLGDVVGYHVRLDKVVPRNHGSILFCTTGILLQRLRLNPTLEGVSHVIIDEAHERSLQTDLLLSLLKKTLDVNPTLKLIVMSATVNTSLFQKYLSCEVIDVPGKVFPVKMHFMEDIDLFKSKLPFRNDERGPEVLNEKIVELIDWITKTKPHGAILCFLPGWHEITHLLKMLSSPLKSHYHVIPLHSKLSTTDQQKVFAPVPKHMHKIILSTDIAESSITIQDVRYVIDTAIKKDRLWNDKTYLSSICTGWVSQTNICQRKGRAGRLGPGESYHLITKEKYNKLDVYPTPEIHRVSLEGTILISKIYNAEKIRNFFHDMPEQPTEMSITKAISTLQNLGILDEDENLTPLGERIKHISLEPRLSKAVLYSSVFGCINPILSIVVMCTVDNELGFNAITGKSIAREQKSQFHKTSDHIALLKCFEKLDKWNSNLFTISNKSLRQSEQIYELHLNELVDSGMLPSVSSCEDASSHNDNNELVRGILFSATNLLIKHWNYGFVNGNFTKHVDNNFISQDNKKIIIRSDSVNYKRKIWPSHFLTYTNHTGTGRSVCMIPETSMISPLTVLLLSQNRVSCTEAKTNTSDKKDILLNIDKLYNVQLCCDEETAELLLKFRTILWKVVNYIIQYESRTVSENLENVKFYKQKLLSLLVRMLNNSSKEIDNCNELDMVSLNCKAERRRN